MSLFPLPRKCDPFSAELFTIDSVPRPVPLLCNSTVTANSSQALQTANNFFAKVWGTCENVSVLNSPFATSLQGQAGTPVTANSTKLTELWQSKSDFCNAFSGAASNVSVCLKLIQMVPTVFLSNQAGYKIWLANVPQQGSGKALEFDEASPFLGLTDELHFDTEFGLMGTAFHPNFAQNGRLFASFNCNKPCQYQAVIAEYTVNGSDSKVALAESARPSEMRRIFTMGPPYTSHHAGQILFSPKDAYLYFMMGNGGGAAEIDKLGLSIIAWDQYEEIDIISKDGNYGWRVYEGPCTYFPPQFPGGNISANSIDAIFPVIDYNHNDVNKNEGLASITGGYFYRSMTDPCMHGSCAKDSPIQCSFVSGSSLPALGYIFSFGEDNSKDIYLLASSGVYRFVRSGRCNHACSKETIMTAGKPSCCLTFFTG
ncbi:Glucose/Sorbosone dehydrogenase [Dillenia turbinata]|uniref:Glucose/Sorbosone dehydrogenase n=1 Tax=Dillenia turbinata TaxID=194707 RepID=A0AAN8Z4W2_9MAGN